MNIKININKLLSFTNENKDKISINIFILKAISIV